MSISLIHKFNEMGPPYIIAQKPALPIELPIYRSFLLSNGSNGMAAYLERPSALVYSKNQFVVPTKLTIIKAYENYKSRDTFGSSKRYQLCAALLRNATSTNGRWVDLFSNCYERILRKEAVANMWRTAAVTAKRSMVVNAARLATCSQVRDILRPRISNNRQLYFTSSMIAGVTTSFCVLSVNIVKTRFQRAAKGTSKVSVLKSIIKFEGAQALCTALLPTFAKIGPQTVVTFVIMDQCSNLYLKIEAFKVLI